LGCTHHQKKANVKTLVHENVSEVDEMKLLLNNMSLKQKVGQLFVVGFYGTIPDSSIFNLIEKQNIGSILLLKYNIENGIQLKKLTDSLTAISLKNNPKIPPFIAVDQEGGVVTRVKIDSTKHHQAQKKITLSNAFNIAFHRGLELKKLGIHVNYSPVLEFITDTTSFLFNRSFQTSQDSISPLGQLMMEGYNSAEIIGVPKHFPGHTNSSIDSHHGLPTVDLDQQRFNKLTTPFKNVIDSSQTDMLMVGHILYPKVDPVYASSISKTIITDHLRTKLKYRGIVVTDDLQMGAISKHYNHENVAVLALKAGVDQLMYSSSPKERQKAFRGVIKAIESGVIPEEDIDHKVLKILRLKKEKGLL